MNELSDATLPEGGTARVEPKGEYKLLEFTVYVIPADGNACANLPDKEKP